MSFEAVVVEVLLPNICCGKSALCMRKENVIHKFQKVTKGYYELQQFELKLLNNL
jgi:hypothetical protein